MMTNGPEATIGRIVEVDLPRPRTRKALVEHADYYRYRAAVLGFLEEYEHGAHAGRRRSHDGGPDLEDRQRLHPGHRSLGPRPVRRRADPRRRHLRTAEAFEGERRHGFARGEGLPGRAWEEGRPILLTDLADPVFLRDDAGRQAGLAAAAAIPVFSGAALKGVLVLFCGETKPTRRRRDLARARRRAPR